MVRVLQVVLALGLLSSAACTSADVAMVEATRSCMQNDFVGMTEALANGDLNYEHGKGVLRSCFADSEGRCLLGPARCAWMKKCLMAEGPCEQIPIAAAFEELPGGKQAFIELMAANNPNNLTVVDLPMKKLLEAANKVAMTQMQEVMQKMETSTEGVRKRLHRPKDLAEREAAEKKSLRKPNAALNAQLKQIQATRDWYLKTFPEDSQRKWVYNLGSLIAWFISACTTELTGTKTMGVGSKEGVYYTQYSPTGIQKPGEYVGPVYQTKQIFLPQLWTCKTGTKAYNRKGIWENWYGVAPGVKEMSADEQMDLIAKDMKNPEILEPSH